MISGLHADAFVESHGVATCSSPSRKAVMHDIRPILDLINGYAAKGVMLPRTEFELSEAIRDFTVVMQGDSCWAAARCTSIPRRIGEIRSLAVR